MEDFYENFNTFMSDAIYEIFLEEFERSKLIRSHYNFLQNFQIILEQVPLWNTPTCEKKWEYIVRHSNCDWLEDYYKSVMYSKVKNIVETYGLDSQELDTIKEFRCPQKEIFLRELLSLCARNFYKNPYLFHSNNQFEKIDNSVKIKKNICDNIKITIHKFLPTKDILKKCNPEDILLNSVFIHKKKNVSDLSIQCDLEINSSTFPKINNNEKQSLLHQSDNTHVSDFSKISIEKINSPISKSLSTLPSIIDGGSQKSVTKQIEDDVIRISVPANIMKNIELPQGAQLSPNEEKENNNENNHTKTTDTSQSSSENEYEKENKSNDSKENSEITTFTSVSDESINDSQLNYNKSTNDDSSSHKESSFSSYSSSEVEYEETHNNTKNNFNTINASHSYQNLTKAFQESKMKKNKKSLFKSSVVNK